MQQLQDNRPARRSKRAAALLVTIVLFLGVMTNSGWGCPFCLKITDTLAESVAKADLVLRIELLESHLTSATGSGYTDATVLEWLKYQPMSNEEIVGTETPPMSVVPPARVRLKRYIPLRAQLDPSTNVSAAEAQPIGELIFGEWVGEQIDPYNRKSNLTPAAWNYLRGSLQRQHLPAEDRLNYFFPYLDHEEDLIANDAYLEFAKAPYQEVWSARTHYSPVLLRSWLTKPRARELQPGLFGLLLGICGTAEQDGPFLKQLFVEPTGYSRNGLDGILGGYCILERQAGTQLALQYLNNPEVAIEQRQAALNVLKFLLDEYPELPQQKILLQMKPALQIDDIGFLIIQEYRLRQVWSVVEDVIAVSRKTVVNGPAATAYALVCPDPKAKAFIQELEQKNPHLVQEARNNLIFEQNVREALQADPELR